MPPAKPAKPTTRKRVRKRKRRAVSSSSSSLSSDSTSSEDESPPKNVKTITTVPQPAQDSSDSDHSSEGSESSSSTDSSTAFSVPKPATEQTVPKLSKPRRSPSPSPPPAEISSFLPEKGDPSAEEKERDLKEKFRKFWMSSVAEGFSDDLEELRKEPKFGTGRLAMLIDSLASGAEVYSSQVDGETTEMDVIMGQQ